MRQVFEPTASTRGIVDPGAARFDLVRLDPAPDLADVVERHWVIRWDLPPGEEFTQVVIPHPNANLVAEPDGVFAAHGIPPGLFARTLRGQGAVVGTKLRPGGLRLLLDRPDAVRRGVVLPAPAVLGAEDEAVAAAGAAAVAAARAGDDAAAVAAVTPLLRVAAARRRTPAASRATRRIGHVLAATVGGALGPHATVPDLAALAGTSTRSLQRLFARWVGVSPAWVLRRHRVHLAADLLAADPARGLAELATSVGYYDQAHFTDDFSRVVGTPPGSFARRCARPAEGALARA